MALDNPAQFLDAVRLVITAPKERYYCDECNLVYGDSPDETRYDIETNSFLHNCRIEGQGFIVRDQWAKMLARKSEINRATGYGVM